MIKFKIQTLILLQRFFLPWNITRVLFLLIGIAVLYQALLDQLWLGILFGSYFIATGIFALGCADGNCQVSSQIQNSDKEIEYKEIN